MAFLSGMISVNAGEKVSFLDHLQKINKVICEKCNKGEKDLKKLNEMSRSNPNNKTIQISQAKSDKCLEYLKANTKCDNIFDKSIDGPCDLNNLK